MSPQNWENMMEIDAEFLEKVYEQVEKIPAGKISTYGKIAELAGYGKASREVGVAMRSVPDNSHLPCHRVVNKNGTLAPNHVFGGQDKQRALLVSEGVTFQDNGLIHMDRHMWPDERTSKQLSWF